jgi:hypothetical protein
MRPKQRESAMDKDAKDRFDRLASERFEPAQHADAQERIAHALEYIAAQLGEMNERARRKAKGRRD